MHGSEQFHNYGVVKQPVLASVEGLRASAWSLLAKFSKW